MCHFVAHYPYSLFLIFLVGIIPSPSRLHPCSHLYQQLFSLPLALTPAGGHPTLEASHLPKVGWCSISPWKSGHYPSWTVELGNHCSFFTIPPTPIWWGKRLTMSGEPLPLLPGWPVWFGGLLIERVQQPKHLLSVSSQLCHWLYK